MKAREILLGGLTILAGVGVVKDYLAKREIISRPVVRSYVGLQDQIDYLDNRIQNEELDDYSIGRLVNTRDSIIENKLKFYAENNNELRSAEKEIEDLDKRQWILLGLSGLGMVGFVLSRKLSR
jgi:hypothetical protein